MQGKERTFTPEVEKVWNKDYQCEYYRGVIIDGEDNIVERCTRTHASYDAALDEAKKKTIVIKRKWVFYGGGSDLNKKIFFCGGGGFSCWSFMGGEPGGGRNVGREWPIRPGGKRVE